jgi:hypothetical protein
MFFFCFCFLKIKQVPPRPALMELLVAGNPNDGIIQWVKDVGRTTSNLQRIAQSLVQAIKDSPTSVARLLGDDEEMKYAMNGQKFIACVLLFFFFFFFFFVFEGGG